MKELRFNEDGAYSAALEASAVPSSILDDLEPIEPDAFREGYRQAASRALYVLNSVLAWVIDSRNPKVAAHQTAIALGSTVTNGQPMERIASTLGVTRACLSKGARSFAKSAGIAPTGSLKSRTEAYRVGRIEAIARANFAFEQKEIRSAKK